MNSASLRAPAARRLSLAGLALILAACGSADAEPNRPNSDAAGSADAAAAASAPTAPTDTAREALLARADLGRIKGDSTAPVWLVVISDFQCPFCKRWHDETAPRLEREYVRTGKLRVAYLNFPISTHRNAQPAHEIAMCAAEQDAFWPVADALFATQDAWKRRSDAAIYFDSLASKIPLDHERLRACVRAGSLRPLIEADYRRSVRIGVGSTPTFFVGDQALIGAQPYEAFAATIDAALDKAARAAAPASPAPGAR